MARLDRLGSAAKEVAQTGAAIGREFGFGLLASVTDLPEPQLREALDRLTNAGLLFVRGTPPESSYIFKHALVQDAAYGTLLRSRRQRLHTPHRRGPRRPLSGDRAGATRAVGPALRWKRGWRNRRSAYWLKAGQQALARSAMAEAVAQLRKGLDVLAGLPDGPWRQQQELDLQAALGAALSATKGWSAAEVGETFARARALAEQLDRPEYLVPLIAGQWVFHSVRAEHRLALAVRRTTRTNRRDAERCRGAIAGSLAQGADPLFLGEFAAARALLERVGPC